MTESSPNRGRHLLYAVLVAAVVFACVAPTLRWPQLTGGNENIVVQTALEIRRGGPWLVPNMLGEPRIKKPPLVAWITAATMRQSTLDQLDNPQAREQAYRDLAWQVRWTGLLAGCVTILATFFLGRALFDARIGLVACVIVGSTILFHKYMRQSTSDVHLAMWVTVANAFLASAILRGRVWSGLIGAAIATALAFLCKGPVALLETVGPAIAMVGLHRMGFVPNLRRVGFIPTAAPTERADGGDGGDEPHPTSLPPLPVHRERVGVRAHGAEVLTPSLSREYTGEGARRRVWLPTLIAIALFAVIALPWFAYVYATVPDVAGTWTKEVSRQGATDLAADPIYSYLIRLPMNWPWIVGIVVGFFVMLRARTAGDWFTLLMLLLPIAIMTLVPDRKERYLLALVAPAAVMAARGMIEILRAGRTERVLRGVHWIVLLGVCVGFPILGATHKELLRVDGTNWYPISMAIWFGVAIAAWAALGLLAQRRWSYAIIVCTWVSVLAMQAMLMWGYKDSPNGRSSLKLLADAIGQDAPRAAVFDWDENVRVAEELAIYLNRVIVRADPATLTPGDSPLVYVTRQDRNEAEPQPVTGWRFLARVPDRRNQWWAFVKHPSPESTADPSPER